MPFSGRITESAAATKSFTTLRIERRVLTTPARTIAIANISTVSVGTHVAPRPKAAFWLLALLFAAMAFASMRTDFSFGPLAPTGVTFFLGLLMVGFAALALRPDDKSCYLLISSNDGVLSRFTATDRGLLDEVRSILTDKINRADDQATFSINFEKGVIENLAQAGPGISAPAHTANGAAHAPVFSNGAAAPSERSGGTPASRPSPPRPARGSGPSRPANGSAADAFVDYSIVLPAIVEMHRFYARQPGTQHLEQRLSELELLMRAGTPTPAQKTRLREIAVEMSQILGAYPQAVELFDHVSGLV